ncbi:hypothetical protein ACQZV8_01310 [Magnetococcales bacterium HHB-1]
MGLSYPKHLWPKMLLLVLLIFISGCLGQESEGIDPEIYAEESFTRNVKRYLFPEIYWQTRLKEVNGEVEKLSLHFQKKRLIYHENLKKRRLFVYNALKQAKEKNLVVDSMKIRRTAIERFRTEIDHRRAQSRLAGKRLKKKQQWRNQIVQVLGRLRR